VRLVPLRRAPWLYYRSGIKEGIAAFSEKRPPKF